MTQLMHTIQYQLQTFFRKRTVLISLAFLTTTLVACKTIPNQSLTTPAQSNTVATETASAQTPPTPSVDEMNTASEPTELTRSELRDVPSPVGGTIQKVYIPGPQSAVAVTCVQSGFEPFFYKDEGENWVGCQQHS